MSILISFLPWFAFWVLLSFRLLRAAVLAGLVLSLLVILAGLARRRGAKILQIGTCLFFLAMALAMQVANPYWIGRWVNLMGSSALALVALVSLVIGHPFTLQYARESVPKDRWDSPAFRRSNVVITWAWFAAFLLNSFFSLGRLFLPHAPIWATWALSLSCFAGAFGFTEWYRRRIHSTVEPG